MSKTDNNIKRYLGYKFYNIDEDDNVEIVRVIGLEDFNNKVDVLTESGAVKKMPINILKSYTPLEPFGFCMFTRVKVSDMKDVIVSAYRLLDVKIDMNEPYCICRQSVNDFLIDMISPEEQYFGVCVTRDDVPANIRYEELAACDDIIGSCMVNFYTDDTLDDILKCLPEKELFYINEILKNNYIEYKKSKNPMYTESLDKKSEDHGWCKDLRTLLVNNNFIIDLDSMRNITAVDFDLSNFLEREDVEDEVYRFNDAMLLFFNQTYKINAVKTMVIKFGYDINMGDFNNSNYILMRDNTDTLYIVVYVHSGEYLEVDLEEELNKMGVSDNLRLSYYNKYCLNLPE